MPECMLRAGILLGFTFLPRLVTFRFAPERPRFVVEARCLGCLPRLGMIKNLRWYCLQKRRSGLFIPHT